MKIVVIAICSCFMAGLLLPAYLTWFFGYDVLCPQLIGAVTASGMREQPRIIGQRKTTVLRMLGKPKRVVDQLWYYGSYNSFYLVFEDQICVKSEPVFDASNGGTEVFDTSNGGTETEWRKF